MNARESLEKRKPSHNVPWDVNCHNHNGEWYAGSLYKLKLELLYNQQCHSWTYIQSAGVQLQQPGIQPEEMDGVSDDDVASDS